MNKQRIVRLSNLAGLIAIILLIYWVFIFITVQVFGLKVFRENLTETFYLSVFGILALMAGASMLSVMMNLTLIASRSDEDADVKRKGRRTGLVFLLSFPVLAALLFLGDHISSLRKEEHLVRSAKNVIETHPDKVKFMTAYRFDKEYIQRTREVLEILSAGEEQFPHIALIVPDTLEGLNSYLHFTGRNHFYGNDTAAPAKKDYIYSSSNEEKEYLKSVFVDGNKESRFRANDGSYELYFPFSDKGKTVVFYFAEQQRYGKIGS